MSAEPGSGREATMLGVVRRWSWGKPSGLIACLTECLRSSCRTSAEVALGLELRITAVMPERVKHHIECGTLTQTSVPIRIRIH